MPVFLTSCGVWSPYFRDILSHKRVPSPRLECELPRAGSRLCFPPGVPVPADGLLVTGEPSPRQSEKKGLCSQTSGLIPPLPCPSRVLPSTVLNYPEPRCDICKMG